MHHSHSHDLHMTHREEIPGVKLSATTTFKLVAIQVKAILKNSMDNSAFCLSSMDRIGYELQFIQVHGLRIKKKGPNIAPPPSRIS